MSDTQGPVRGRLRGAIAGVGSFLAAIELPDLDASLGLHHRSAITHSILIPLIIWCGAALALRRIKAKNLLPGQWRTLCPSIGVCRGVCALLFLGFAVHLAADCVPKAWQGRALVYFPGPTRNTSFGFQNEILSAAWLATNATLAFACCHRILAPDGSWVRWSYQAAALILLVAYALLVDAHQHLAGQKALIGVITIAAGHAVYWTILRPRTGVTSETARSVESKLI